MKTALLLTALVALGGCNVVVTKDPLFTRANEAGAATLKPGLWRMEMDPKCAVDETKPLADWPECAAGAVLADGMAGFYDRKSDADKPIWKEQPVILAAGDPRVLQLQTEVGGDINMESSPYLYLGVRPTKTDSDGRITEFSLWPVLCGPPPPGAQDPLTKHLLPGLTAKPDEPVCTTTSIAALQNAAKASVAWTAEIKKGHWVRAGGR